MSIIQLKEPLFLKNELYRKLRGMPFLISGMCSLSISCMNNNDNRRDNIEVHFYESTNFYLIISEQNCILGWKSGFKKYKIYVSGSILRPIQEQYISRNWIKYDGYIDREKNIFLSQRRLPCSKHTLNNICCLLRRTYYNNKKSINYKRLISILLKRLFNLKKSSVCTNHSNYDLSKYDLSKYDLSEYDYVYDDDDDYLIWM